MENSRLTLRSVLTSILFVLGCTCLVVSIATGLGFGVSAAINPAADGGETVIAAVLGFVTYGPILVWTVWPIAVPVICVVGIGLAAWRGRVPVPKWLEITVMAYGGLVLLVALTMMSGRR